MRSTLKNGSNINKFLNGNWYKLSGSFQRKRGYETVPTFVDVRKQLVQVKLTIITNVTNVLGKTNICTSLT